MVLCKHQLYASVSRHFSSSWPTLRCFDKLSASLSPLAVHCQQQRPNVGLRFCRRSVSSLCTFTKVTEKNSSDLSSYSNCNRRRFSVRLSPNEVTTILRANESTQDINFNSIKSFDTNQLSSNTPIEDTKSEARCLLTTGMMFGVFDGHGGPACAQVVAKRLVNYIAAALLPTDILNKLLYPNLESDTADPPLRLLDVYHDHFDLVKDLHQLYELSFNKYLQDLAEVDQSNFLMRTTLEKVFQRLDDDISNEALDTDLLISALSGSGKDTLDRSAVDSLSRKTLSIAEAGAVGCVAHIDGEHLHVASTGDCQAVLGCRGLGETNWVGVPLTTPHNSENLNEIKRLYSEHPIEEQDNLIQNDRLLGHLMPFRAFGDVRFKWTKQVIREKLAPYLGDQATIQHSITPPYLTARPEVTYHKLRSQDRFMILGTDGLWDFLSPNEAVRLVGEHMAGKTILSPFALPSTTEKIPLGIIHRTLMRRSESFKLKPTDSNAATHLIRHALATTDYGLDHQRIAHFLTIPKDSVRLFRDDITVIIVFFDSAFLRQRPL